MSCTSISHMLFPKKKISVRGSISSSLMGEKILSKREHSFRGNNNLVLQLVLIIKSFLRASLFTSYMLLMSSFSVVDAKGGEVLGTKAMKIVSNTKHHKIKILILQVVLALWSKIGSK
jgi:diacylglycerol kinase